MECAYEYRPILYFLTRTEFPVEPNFGGEETQREFVEWVNGFIEGLPNFIEKEMVDNKGWEINSHSITITPEKNVLFSILLQRKRT